MSNVGDITLNDIRIYSEEVIREYVYEYYMGNDIGHENISEFLKTDYGQSILHKNSKQLFREIMETVNDYVDLMPVPDID
jgi:hypothetical protein